MSGERVNPRVDPERLSTLEEYSITQTSFTHNAKVDHNGWLNRQAISIINQITYRIYTRTL